MGDGDYSLTDPDHTYDAVSRREISVMDNNVLSTYMEVQGEADGYRYAVVDGQAVLLSYGGAETSLCRLSRGGCGAKMLQGQSGPE